MSFKLISSPLQGFTDFRFRNTFSKYFGEIDSFYAPYIRLDDKLEVKPAYARDILPENNKNVLVVPQVMTKDADEFLFVASYVQKLGYNELNWNLGCPYPMVTKRGMGSGLLKNASKIDEILHKVHEESDIKVSIKMRLGLEKTEEIFQVLPVLEKYPIKSIAIHPRIGKQLYKGKVDLDAFQRCIDSTSHILFYNGDITTVSQFNKLAERFPTINHWMIGRGIIADPFLPAMIKSNTISYSEDRIEIFRKFHEALFNEYSLALSGPSHLMMKMLLFWEYFSTAFTKSPKGLKKIKKAKTIGAYHEAVREILNKEKE